MNEHPPSEGPAARDGLPELPVAEAEVLWHEPDLVLDRPKPGKIIDASIAFMDAAPLGTKLYTADAMRAYALVTLASQQAATPPVSVAPAVPIDMVLHCPACGMQHIDAADDIDPYPTPEKDAAWWGNPPHRTHLCHGCGHKWRPADVPTNGVAAVKTRGKDDSPIVTQAGKDREAAAVPVAWSQPIQWAQKQSEQVIKVTRHTQLQYGFTAPLYAAPAVGEARQALTDAEIDSLDNFCLHWLAPRGRESVREFARMVQIECAKKWGLTLSHPEQAEGGAT